MNWSHFLGVLNKLLEVFAQVHVLKKCPCQVTVQRDTSQLHCSFFNPFYICLLTSARPVFLFFFGKRMFSILNFVRELQPYLKQQKVFFKFHRRECHLMKVFFIKAHFFLVFPLILQVCDFFSCFSFEQWEWFASSSLNGEAVFKKANVYI